MRLPAWPKPGVRARSALRITATSITSWTMAAGTGITQPRLAASIARIESPIPATMLSTAIRRRPLRDRDRFADPVETIGQDHHVGGFRRRVWRRGAQRDPDIGAGQRRRIVDAVADHDGRMQPLFGTHDLDLVGRRAVGQHRIEIERVADRMRGGGAVAGDHDHAGNAGLAQQPDRPRGYRPAIRRRAAGRRRPVLRPRRTRRAPNATRRAGSPATPSRRRARRHRSCRATRRRPCAPRSRRAAPNPWIPGPARAP